MSHRRAPPTGFKRVSHGGRVRCHPNVEATIAAAAPCRHRSNNKFSTKARSPASSVSVHDAMFDDLRPRPGPPPRLIEGPSASSGQRSLYQQQVLDVSPPCTSWSALHCQLTDRKTSIPRRFRALSAVISSPTCPICGQRTPISPPWLATTPRVSPLPFGSWPG